MAEQTKLLEIKDLKKHFTVKKSGFNKPKQRSSDLTNQHLSEKKRRIRTCQTKSKIRRTSRKKN